MKIKSLKTSGIIIMLMGTGASLGNYLWLIGVLPKPEESQMEARWWYTLASYFVAAIAFAISADV